MAVVSPEIPSPEQEDSVAAVQSCVLGKRERSEDTPDSPDAKRQTGTTLLTEEEEDNSEEDVVGDVSEGRMVEIIMKDLRSKDEAILIKALKEVNKFLSVAHHDTGASNEDDKSFYISAVQNSTTFVDIGGHSAVVSAMGEFSHCEELWGLGAAVLWTACSKNPCVREPVAKLGCIEILINGMKLFESSSLALFRGFRALYSIVDISTKNAEALIQNPEWLPFLVKCLTKFNDNAKLTHEACGLFFRLSRVPKSKKGLVNADAVSALGLAYDKFRANDSKLKATIRKALNNLL